ASGHDALGPFVLETRAKGSAVREMLDPNASIEASRWLALARLACGALARLHALSDGRGPLGIVHGDISPDNLFYQVSSGVTFVDLSSATWRDAPLSAFADDRGTLPYAAPELARGDARPSQATDTYALAATLLAIAVGPITDAATDASRLLEVGTRGV